MRPLEGLCRPVVGLLLCLTVLQSRADEGMWMPHQVPDLASRLSASGRVIDLAPFSRLDGPVLGAVGAVGGCTVSFVSPSGLLLTNHHCVEPTLQFHSRPGGNLVDSGFRARTRGDELPAAPGSRLLVTTGIRDITTGILGGINPRLPASDHWTEIDRRIKDRVAQCERGGDRCQVAPFWEGSRYFEIVQTEYPDIRLVWAPPLAVGAFGGDLDNWRWPRHAGDFAFYRVYAAPDGRPAPPSPSNVPLRPRHWLRIDPGGAAPGERVFVAGYPGTTYRLSTHHDTRTWIEWYFPRNIRRADSLIAILDRVSALGEEHRIRALGRRPGLANSRAKLQSIVDGFRQGRQLERRAARDRDLRAWVAGSPRRDSLYGRDLVRLDSLQALRDGVRERDALLSDIFRFGGTIATTADKLWMLVQQRSRKDSDRDAAYQERNWPRLRDEQIRLQKSWDTPIERGFLGWLLAEAAALPPDQRLHALDSLTGNVPSTSPALARTRAKIFADSLVASTRLGDLDFRLAVFDGDSSAVTAFLADPFVAFLHPLEALAQANRDRDKSIDGELQRTTPSYARALLEMHGGLVAPDANGTLRVAHGTVRGRTLPDGQEGPSRTTLRGLAERARDTVSHPAPRRVLEAIAAHHPTPWTDSVLKVVPVDFLTTIDATSGNSGSPTLDADGKVIGVLFDGLYESNASIHEYDADLNRSIHVDIRYLLWTLSEVDAASDLLTELGVAPPARDAKPGRKRPPTR